jgi:hypothetical protein
LPEAGSEIARTSDDTHYVREPDDVIETAQFSTVSPGTAARSVSLLTTAQLPSERATAALNSVDLLYRTLDHLEAVIEVLWENVILIQRQRTVTNVHRILVVRGRELKLYSIALDDAAVDPECPGLIVI